MEAFTILTGAAALLDISLRLVAHLREIQKSAERVDEEIASLSQEIESLVSVDDSIECLWLATHENDPGVSAKDAAHVEDTWKKLDGLLQECRVEATKLEQYLVEVVGKNGSRVTGKWDGLRKQMRRKEREGDYQLVRDRLSQHREGIQVLLATLNMYGGNSQSDADADIL
jgi:hypothetical protein